MGLKDKLSKTYTEYFMEKNGDRITQIQGNVVSVKIEEKAILWIFHKLQAILIVRPERSKSVIKCIYRRNRWFKKITFIPIAQGNFVMVTGLKGKKGKRSKENRETIEIMNIRNLTNKKDLIPVEGKIQRQRQRVQRMK